MQIHFLASCNIFKDTKINYFDLPLPSKYSLYDDVDDDNLNSHFVFLLKYLLNYNLSFLGYAGETRW